jgi:hypothetical protein
MPTYILIHSGIFPQIEAVACVISAQVDDQPSSTFVAISSGILAEFGAVVLRQRQKMKIVSAFAPQWLACHSSRAAKNYLTRSVPPQACFLPLIAVCMSTVKTISFNQMKRQEAQSRMAAVRKARRSPAAAAALQHRASLVGNGAKWRITNLNQVAHAIARWA